MHRWHRCTDVRVGSSFPVLATVNVGPLSEVKLKRKAGNSRHSHKGKPSKSKDALSVGVERKHPCERNYNQGADAESALSEPPLR